MPDQAIHDPNDTESLLRVMHQAADAAGRAIIPFFRTGLDIEEKASDRRFDPLPHADHENEDHSRNRHRQDERGQRRPSLSRRCIGV